MIYYYCFHITTGQLKKRMLIYCVYDDIRKKKIFLICIASITCGSSLYSIMFLPSITFSKAVFCYTLFFIFVCLSVCLSFFFLLFIFISLLLQRIDYISYLSNERLEKKKEMKNSITVIENNKNKTLILY